MLILSAIYPLLNRQKIEGRLFFAWRTIKRESSKNREVGDEEQKEKEQEKKGERGKILYSYKYFEKTRM